ncbi:hypothetical protein N0B51_06380 [Tsuneonella sp. YG55]|uniref:ASCH domain-containing protein n=1 Tax=Tsuneonella litorea TaxID=2976475 RepID=A0A9X3AL05_9SPHN|nr:hypothetical protein [Tsuneonella litorea]MCT2558603.1 hypothetical protein [Tsuneonella litorea]
MMFARALRDRVRSGDITCSVRVWQAPRVKSGGLYPMEPGRIRVDSVREIALEDVTDDLARRSGFADVHELMATARHGRGENIYLIEFAYLPPD